MKRYVVDLELWINGITKGEIARQLCVKPSLLVFIKKKNASRIYRIGSNCETHASLDYHIKSLLSRFNKKPFKKTDGIIDLGLLIGVFYDTANCSIKLDCMNIKQIMAKFPKTSISIVTYPCDKVT